MSHVITASAPGKLMLFGEHAVVYGKPCIVTAVDQRLSVSVRKNGKDAFHLDAPDLGLSAYSTTIDDLGGEGLPKGVRFIETLYKNFLKMHPQSEGIDVVTSSEFSSYFGFGSSSAVTVAFAKALTTLYGFSFSNRELFNMCYETVLEVQGVGSGFDVAAAVYGGTLYYVTPGDTIENIEFDGSRVVVGYTGIKADTPTLVRQVAENRRKNKERIDSIFDDIGDLVFEAREKIAQGDMKALGKIMNKNQDLLVDLGVSSQELDAMCSAANSSGAFGSKLSGAGGGDCMISLVSGGDKDKVRESISEHGRPLDVKLGAPGVRLE